MKLWKTLYENLGTDKRNQGLFSMLFQCNTFAVISLEKLQLYGTHQN